MSESELSLCKKCGGKAELEISDYLDGWYETAYSVCCDVCESSEKDWFYDEQEAIEAWNTRHEVKGEEW